MLELATKQPNSNTSAAEAEKNATNNDHHNQPHFSDESNVEYEAPTQSTTPPSIKSIIKRKLLLLTPLLICLYILTDTTHHNVPLIGTAETQQKQHLAFVTALSRHPPALRVFRIVSESAFLLFCTAFALWAWETCRSSGPLPNNHDESLEQPSNQSAIVISSQSIGKLLFSPPPNSITDNAAWMVYKKHHHRLLFRRRKRRTIGSNGGGMSRNEEDLIESQPQQQPEQQQEEQEDDEDLSSLLMDTPSQNMRLRAQQDLLQDRINDNDDDNYIENDQKGNRNEHDPNTEPIFEEPSAAPLPKPPSSTSVLGAALDITTLMCMFLIFFTISSAEGGRYIDHKARGGININPSSNHIISTDEEGNNRQGGTEDISYMKFFAKIAAPLFPITLFIMSALLLIIPWRKRKVLWTIVSLTLGAPFYEVTFRDGFIGDILTSTVRPLQDLAYTVVFLFLGLQSWWDSQAYSNSTTATTEGGISMDDVPLERSWLLHTFILPACTLSPLWWRFLQNLRQCFDSKQRWPYLGNAFKYMLAAEVAIFGMFDPSVKKHPVWITCFFVATLYQVWWDVFMDWGLLEWNEDEVTYQYYHSKSSSGGRDGGRKGLFWWWPYKLRSRRAYPHRWIYYTIFIINFCLRFVGMLTLIPPVYLSRRTGLIVNTWYDPDVQLFVGSMAASAEIFRRTIWALLRLEWEVIKTSPSPLMSGKNEVPPGEDDDLLDLLEEETDMKPMAISSSSSNGGGRLGFLTSNERRPSISLASLSDMSNLNGIQILSELCAWATIFSGIAIIAAAHREVL
eukprot:scaffold2258_cov84-Skeletonema_dohrnii-CCMP3373.AAC.4